IVSDLSNCAAEYSPFCGRTLLEHPSIETMTGPCCRPIMSIDHQPISLLRDRWSLCLSLPCSRRSFASLRMTLLRDHWSLCLSILCRRSFASLRMTLLRDHWNLCLTIPCRRSFASLRMTLREKQFTFSLTHIYPVSASQRIFCVGQL